MTYNNFNYLSYILRFQTALYEEILVFFY